MEMPILLQMEDIGIAADTCCTSTKADAAREGMGSCGREINQSPNRERFSTTSRLPKTKNEDRV